MLLEKQALSKLKNDFYIGVVADLVAVLFISATTGPLCTVCVRMHCVSQVISTVQLLVFGVLEMTTQTNSVFSTCDFCDAHKSDMTGKFRVIAPMFKDYGGLSRFHGQVLTVKCYADNSHVKLAVESPGQGRVLVVDGAGSLQKALLGGNLAAAAARNGWAGVVVDGCVRDWAEISVLPIGIRALALNPMPTLRSDQGLTGVLVWIQGTAVHTGDWLYADADGMVVSSDALHIS